MTGLDNRPYLVENGSEGIAGNFTSSASLNTNAGFTQSMDTVTFLLFINMRKFSELN